MKAALGDVRVIGGMQPAQGGSAFARARVVVEVAQPDASRLIVRKFLPGGAVEGDPLTAEEWSGLVASGSAMELGEPVQAALHIALWLLRQNFSFRDEAERDARRLGALLHAEWVTQTRVLLVQELKAGILREEWGDRAFNDAWQSAKRDKLPEAVEKAELAMDLARGLVDDRIALVSLLYDRAGDKARSEGYLELARNSKGEEFYQRIHEKKERFSRECSAAPPPSPSRIAPEIHASARRAIDNSIASLPGRPKAA